MNIPLNQIQPFVYTAPDGLQLEVLFVLDVERKGYINATAIAKQFGKEPIHWLRNSNVQQYINSLIRHINDQPANSPTGTKLTSYDDLG